MVKKYDVVVVGAGPGSRRAAKTASEMGLRAVLIERGRKPGDKASSGCGKCVKICPMDLWELRREKAKVSKDYAEKCLECGSCWLVCKFDAIDFSYPKGGTGVIWKYG